MAWHGALSKQLQANIRTQLWEDPMSHVNTLGIQVRPELDPWHWWSTPSLGSDLCPKLWEPSTSCSSIFIGSPLAGHFGQTKTLHQVWQQYYWPGLSHLCQGLLQIMYYLFPSQTRVPQALRIAQAAPNSQETLEFYLHGFHREASPFIGLYLDPSYC